MLQPFEAPTLAVPVQKRSGAGIVRRQGSKPQSHDEKWQALNGTDIRHFEGRRWVVACVYPRQEKQLSQACAKKSVPFFLPLRVNKHDYGRGRRPQFDIPLFIGYLFCAVDCDERLYLRQTEKVFKIINVFNEDGLLEELSQLKKGMSRNLLGEPCRMPARGEKVIVKSGFFTGTKGIVQGRKGKQRLIISVDCLGLGVPLEIDAGELELLKE